VGTNKKSGASRIFCWCPEQTLKSADQAALTWGTERLFSPMKLPA